MDTKPTTPTDAYLARCARQGDAAALTALVERMRPRLFALAYAELRHYEDAHDALAAGVLQICRHIGELREPERVMGWMQSVVRNEARRLRRGGLATVPLSDAEASITEGELSLWRLDVERVLARMPERQAEALRRFYFADVPIPEIARAMGATTGAVKMWLYRGRRNLRTNMEGYRPMTATETRISPAAAPTWPAAPKAAVLQCDLEPELRERIAASLQKAGYAPAFLTPNDLGEPGSTEPGPWDVLKEYAACVLVEPCSERSVYEYLLLLRASWETESIPVAVVLESSRPDPFRALAFHTLGVAGLASRDAPESLDYLFLWTGGRAWSRELTAVLLFADDEARRAGQERIATEHLLLGLLRDTATAHLLREDLGVSPEQIADMLRPRLTRGAEYAHHPWRNLTADADAALQSAREEAMVSGAGVVRPRDLLIGLLGESDGLAGRTLSECGVTAERIRAAVATRG